MAVKREFRVWAAQPTKTEKVIEAAKKVVAAVGNVASPTLESFVAAFRKDPEQVKADDLASKLKPASAIGPAPKYATSTSAPAAPSLVDAIKNARK